MEVPKEQKEQINLSLSDQEIDKRIAQILPEETVRRLLMLPIRVEGDLLYVATVSPVNLPGIDEVRLITGLKVRTIPVARMELERAISEQFSANQMSKQAIVDMTLQELGTARMSMRQEEVLEIDDAPVVDLVNQIIRGAVNDSASDIHLEPQLPEMRVRYRINGILHDITTVPRYIEPSIVSRIKLLADMDITEKRRAQDGHITMAIGRRQVDLRVSSVLTTNGEKLVIRVLDKETMLINLGGLGLSNEQHVKLKTFIDHPYGMILATGPTGSGKSTTLYAALSELNSVTQNIMTVENPVEYQMNGISQIQVIPSINLTFASALRTIVRQDPDVIMVGEIRDSETADMSVQAALTGHLVFSTLHTNDAPGAVVRLIDMGVQPFLIASAVLGVVGQRLVRKICPQCKEYYRPSQEVLDMLRAGPEVKELARGKGCEYCRNTGYRGRLGVYEVFEIDEDVKRLIIAKTPTSEIKKMAIAKGMKSLSVMGREKILQGLSTIEDVGRAIYLEED
jgi:type IV pilus assembly protein PilB